MGGSVKRSGFDPLQRLLLSTLLLAVLFFGSTATCYGATLKTIPSTNLSVAYSNKLLLGYHNYTATWSGVSGKMIKGKYNYDLLCVPIKTKTGSFTYTDFLDLNFTNVGKINGRQIDAKVHFNSMTVGKRNASGERGDNYFAVCYLADESMWMSSTIAGIGAGYRAPKTIDITTTMYWHDTGKVVNLPFFQCLSDIDAGANYFKEAWEAKSGFSGIFYNTVHVSSALAAIELRRQKLLMWVETILCGRQGSMRRRQAGRSGACSQRETVRPSSCLTAPIP